MKFNPLPEVVGGKRLVVVDDSIVRGNTTRQIVKMLRDAGRQPRCTCASRRRRSATPATTASTCPRREEMVAHGRTVEEIAHELGCDSLAYLSLDGVYEAIGIGRDTHCDACFTGDYPLERTGVGQRQVRARGAGRDGPAGSATGLKRVREVPVT